MELSLQEFVPSRDPILPLLFGASGAATATGSAATLFPGGHFRSDAALERRLAHLDAARGRDAGASRAGPAAVAELLRNENAFAPLHPAQDLNLDLAGKHGTVFVLTGQQPGLLGGPVLWLYKALTAVALAEQATRRLGRPVIPIFWVAGDDSDLRECNQVELLEDLPPGVPPALSLDYPDPGLPLAVGARKMDEASLRGLYGVLGRVWKPGTVEAARRMHAGCGSPADAFLRLLQRWLGPRGVLFLNGFSPAVRAAGRPVLERAVSGWAGLQAALASGTAALRSAGLEPPVALREGVVHAFALRDGARHRLYADNPGATGRPSRIYTADAPSADLGPRLAGVELTHDVFTRPLLADTLLPVLGHVLGPSELRYFAQMAPAFTAWTGDMPLVHPRQSVSVAADFDRDLFAAEGMSLAEAAVLKPSDLRARLRRKAWDSHPAARAIPAGPPRELLDALRLAHARHFRDTGPLDRLERSLQRSWGRYLAALGNMAYAEAASGSGGRGAGDAGESGGQGGPAGAGEAELFGRLRWLGNGGGQDRHLNLHSLLDAVGEDGVEDLIGKLAADPDAAEPGARIFTWPGGRDGRADRVGRDGQDGRAS